MKVILVVGTRPEAIKLIPVYNALKAHRDVKVYLLSTGQHKEMLDQIFDFFNVAPDVDISLMTQNQTLPGLTSLILQDVSLTLEKLKPDLVIVQGDTTTAMATSLAAYYLKIRVAHIEAGLRTYNKYAPFPEEVNRRIISEIADFHFAPTCEAAIALEKENVKGRIETVGNTIIDSLLYGLELTRKNDQYYANEFKNILDIQSKLIIITMHRRESFGGGFENICEAIKHLADSYPEFTFVYPVHLNPNVQLVVREILSGRQNIKLIDPLPYGSMIYLMSKSFLILTDSGGIQEEAPTLKIPVIILRDTTERNEAIDAGCAVLGTTSKNKIIEVFKSIVDNMNIYMKMRNSPNPFGDGKASSRIVDVIYNESPTYS